MGWSVMLWSMPTDAPCSWPVDSSCFPADVTETNPDLLRSAVDTATAVLWAFTGRQFGLCDVEYMPPRDVCRPCIPTLFEGEWYNIDPSAGCTAISLPGPVFEVTSVVDESGSDLRFGSAPWGVEVFGAASVIRYVRGLPVPSGAAAAVGRLALQVFFQCSGDRRCKLPANTTSVTRQGVSASFEPPEPGKTGLADVDMWVQSVNPHGLSQQTEVVL